ncbi:MAG: hypothetical protein AAFY41_17525, partial [Bacteroidota bacterium]
ISFAVLVIDRIIHRISKDTEKKNRTYSLYQFFMLNLVSHRRHATNIFTHMKRNNEFASYHFLITDWGRGDAQKVEDWVDISAIFMFYYIVAQEYLQGQLDEDMVDRYIKKDMSYYYPHFMKQIIHLTKNDSSDEAKRYPTLNQFLQPIEEFASRIKVADEKDSYYYWNGNDVAAKKELFSSDA